MSYSLARAGASVVYVTDNLPMFDADFSAFDENFAIEKVVNKSFSAPKLGPLDWVIIIPSGGITDIVYDAAEACATASGARIALMSFETPNWFNALSPYKRSGLSWEAWRRCVARGGLVLTIAKEGIEPARAFYSSPNHRAPIGFAFWHPPINDIAADGVPPAAERQRVVVFTRTQDPHKGAGDLLRIDPETLDGRILSVVFGRSVDDAYLLALRRHFSRPGNAIEVHERITDAQKFELLARARLLLFPSYFEGFGYPVVEAAYMGVPSVAYDLAVVRETIGDAALYVPPGDHEAFSKAIVQALREEPGPHIRARMRIDADTLSAGNKLTYLLDRYRSIIKPLKGSPVPKSVKVPLRKEVLATPLVQADWMSVAQPVRFQNLQGVLTPGVLTVTGLVKAGTPDALVTVEMAGAHVAPLLLESLAADQFKPFVMRGPVGPVAASGGFCTVKINEKGKTVVARSVPLTMAPEFLCLSEMWACSGEVGAASGRDERIVIVADLRRLLAVGDDTLALSELAAHFRSSGFRVAMLLLAKDGAGPPSAVETDLLPLADTVHLIPPSMDLRAYLSDLAGTGAVTLVAAADLVADPPGRPELVVEFGEAISPIVLSRTTGADATVPTRVRYVPSIAAASRSEGQRARRRLVVVGGSGEKATDIASRCIREVFPVAAKLTGAVRFIVQKTLANRIEDRTLLATDTIGGGWPIEVAGLVRTLEAARDAGRILVLDLGDRRDDVLRALGEHLQVPVLALSEGLDAEEIARHLAAPLAGTRRDSLADALARGWPPPPEGLPIGKLAAARASSLQSLAWGAAPQTPCSLAVGQTVSFCTQSGDSNAFLVGGWADRGINGSAMAARGAMIAFIIPSPPGQTVTIEILMRSAAPPKTPLSCVVMLNEVSLGTTVLDKPGSKSFSFTVPTHVWRMDEPQVLIFKPKAVKIEETEHTPILVALAVTTPPVPIDWSSVDPDHEPKALAQDAPTGGRWHFRAEGNGLPYLCRGWSSPEPDFTWSDGSAAGILLGGEIASASPMLMVVEADAFVMPAHPVQRATIHVGDTCLGEIRSDVRWKGRFAFGVPPEMARDGFDSLLFQFPDALSPAAVDGSGDQRRLAFSLRSIALDPASDASRRGHFRRLAATDLGARIEIGGIAHSAGILRLAGPGPAQGRIVLRRGDGQVATRPFPSAHGWEAWIGLTDLAPDNNEVTLVSAPDPDTGPPLVPEEAEFWPIGPGIGATFHLVVQHRAPLPFLLTSPALPTTWSFGLHDRCDILGAGWSGMEAAFTWSVARRAEIDLSHVACAADFIVVRLDAVPFLAPGLTGQRVAVSDGAGLSALVQLSRGEVIPVWFALPGSAIPALTLEFPDAASPASLGHSTDGRLLGVQIHGLHLDQAATAGQAPIESATFAVEGWVVFRAAETAEAIVIELTGPAGSGIARLAIAGSNVFVTPRTVDGHDAVVLAGPRGAEMIRIVEGIEEADADAVREGRVVGEIRWRTSPPNPEAGSSEPGLAEG